MTENKEQIERLNARLDNLVRTQIDFQKHVNYIRQELERLKMSTTDSVDNPIRQETPPEPRPKPPVREPPKYTSPPVTAKSPPSAGDGEASQTGPPPVGSRSDEPTFGSVRSESAFSDYVSSYTDSARADLEKFIGENLISKIGIIVLVLGVGIGAKYAIDNDWISPLMRIVFGYAMGFALLGFAVRLKAKYLNFSAVLLSGGMAILYFVTYFGYALYSLISQPSAFGLMAIFTAFTVAAAIYYNRQIIAHIGLVGAYAVPFLLSDDTGNYLFLFTYMAIINAGILAISVRKFWKPLFYTSSVFTWLIFGGWFSARYAAAEHFYLALIFLGIFFATFYATKIVHGVMQPKSEDSENLISLFITAFIFYGFCLAISDVQAEVWKYAVFFSYLGIISLAILLTSYRFYGRVLVYLSYPFTWLIFGAWFFSRYRADEHFLVAAVFTGVFFAIYYGATLVYRLVTDEIGMMENSALVLTNSFIFYGFGYAIVDSRETLRGFAGVFTVAHAGFHSLVAHAVSRFKASAVDVVQVLAVLILTFATIAIPVQFDGNLVTLIWAVEAAVLFWFGRTRLVQLFEFFSYPIMFLATSSLILDWITAYADRTMQVSEFNRRPLANGDLITALVFVAAFAFIYVINRDKQYEPAIGRDLTRPFGYAVACVALVAFYNTFRIEIDNYHHFQIVNLRALADTSLTGDFASQMRDLARLNVIWQLNYTMLFLIAMSVVNLVKLRSVILAFTGSAFGLLSLLIFLTVGMQFFYELRLSFMVRESVAVADWMNNGIRHISYAITAGLLYSFYRYSRSEILSPSISADKQKLAVDAIIHGTVLITASCELVNLMGQFHIADSTKFGLSILWGVYALFLIVLGIAKNKKHLRIAAIALLGVTLVKLFFYDIAELDTIPKTILFVSLGLLMLIVSFLYNKYKRLIFDVAASPDE